MSARILLTPRAIPISHREPPRYARAARREFCTSTHECIHNAQYHDAYIERRAKPPRHHKCFPKAEKLLPGFSRDNTAILICIRQLYAHVEATNSHHTGLAVSRADLILLRSLVLPIYFTRATYYLKAMHISRQELCLVREDAIAQWPLFYRNIYFSISIIDCKRAKRLMPP